MHEVGVTGVEIVATLGQCCQTSTYYARFSIIEHDLALKMHSVHFGIIYGIMVVIMHNL